MSSVAAGNASRDVKVYPICSPWFGKAGAEFERTFEPDFLANVGSHIKDKYSRHLVTHGYMYIHLARTWEMIADPFTKVTGKDIFLMTRNAFYGKQL